MYIILCKNGRLYTGVSPDVEKRFEKHASGKGALFTKLNVPERVLGKKPFPSKSDALKEEYRLKQLHTPDKLQWVRELQPDDVAFEQMMQEAAEAVKAHAVAKAENRKYQRKKMNDPEVVRLLTTMDEIE